MRHHRHILFPHCKGRQACTWVCCVVCNWYGDDPHKGRWVHNPYEFYPEPTQHGST